MSNSHEKHFSADTLKVTQIVKIHELCVEGMQDDPEIEIGLRIDQRSSSAFESGSRKRWIRLTSHSVSQSRFRFRKPAPFADTCRLLDGGLSVCGDILNRTKLCKFSSINLRYYS